MTEPPLLEYQTLREESAQARNAQQAILQWSLGAFAVIFAGALAASASVTPDMERLHLAVFGFALPGLVVGSCLAWVGELIRMERVGFYIRGRERTFWQAPEKKVSVSSVRDRQAYPLLWENYIASGGTEAGQRKQWSGYMGAVLIYADAYVASFAVFLLTVWAHDFGSHALAWRLGASLYTGAVTMACLLTFWRRARLVLEMARGVAGLAHPRPATDPGLTGRQS